MMADDNYVEVRLYPVSSFIVELPDVPNDLTVELTVLYAVSDEDIHAEAWLQSSKRSTVKYLADVYEKGADIKADDDVEGMLIEHFNASEVFNDSLNALITENYDYFNVER